METKIRLSFIDAMKGFAIITLVLYHILTPSSFKNGLNNISVSFLIMFFCLSGYFYTPGKNNYIENLKVRAKGIMVPFFKFSFVFWVIGTIYHMIVNKLSFFEAICCLRNFYGGCIWNRVIQNAFDWDYHHLGSLYLFLADFWFLIALMFAFILFLVFADWALESNKKSIGTMAGLLVIEAILLKYNVTLPYNIQNTPYFAMLLLLGSYLHKVELFGYFEKKYSVSVDWIVGLVILIVGVILSLKFEPSVNLFRGIFGENQVLSMLTTTLSSVFFICGLGIIMRRIELTGMRIKEIGYIGENSLYVFVCHVFFAYFISIFTGIKLPSAFNDEVLPATKDHIYSFILSIVCIALSLGVMALSKKIKDSLAQKKG